MTEMAEMTEIQEVRQETERERSQLVRSVRNGRPGRSKASACDLPSDFLSKNEKEALNGPVQVLKLTNFYTKDEFKELPIRFQIEYLNYLLDKYAPVGLRVFSTDIFGMSVGWLNLYAASAGYLDQLHRPGKKGGPTHAFIAARDRLTLDLEAYLKEKARESATSPILDQYEAEHGLEAPKLVGGIILDRHIDNGPPEIADIASKSVVTNTLEFNFTLDQVTDWKELKNLIASLEGISLEEGYRITLRVQRSED